MLDAFYAGFLASEARVMLSLTKVFLPNVNIPLADAYVFRGHASYFVLSTPFAGKRVPDPALSCLHIDDGMRRRRIVRRGLVGKSDHAKTESDLSTCDGGLRGGVKDA